MTNSFAKEARAWGAKFAFINLALVFVAPPFGDLDVTNLFVVSPIIGFFGGVSLYLLVRFGEEAVRLIEYMLRKVDGVKWNPRNADLSVQVMTKFGLFGTGIFLLLSLFLQYALQVDLQVEPWLTYPLFAIFGIIFGICAYFFSWAVLVCLSYLTKRFDILIRKWKNHEYRK